MRLLIKKNEIFYIFYNKMYLKIQKKRIDNLKKFNKYLYNYIRIAPLINRDKYINYKLFILCCHNFLNKKDIKIKKLETFVFTNLNQHINSLNI